MSADRRTRHLWVVLLGGPLVWLAHFALTYLVAEAGCTGDGPGLDRFDPRCRGCSPSPPPRSPCWPAPSSVVGPGGSGGRRRSTTATTIVATSHRATATMLGGIGLLLAGFSAAAVLLVGVMTPLLPGCGS
ncbi:MAG: hypothetical protein R2755_17390 [Acidimicrobiales bacterium]